MKFVTYLSLALGTCCALPLAAAPVHSGRVDIHVLAINDFHGAIQPRTVTSGNSKRVSGGAAHLAGMVRRYRAAQPNTLVVNAGDMVGGSPPISSLFQDEPTVEFLNAAGWDVGTLGNHEFDEGIGEMLRLWKGGVHKASRYYPKPFPGARFPVVCANLVKADTGETYLPPYVVKKVDGARVGFIGAVTAELPTLVSPQGLKGARVLDPAEAVNRWAKHLGKYGVHAIVVLMHEGGQQNPEREDGILSGPIVDLVRRFDKDVDLVVSGHSHQYTNAFLGNTLVTQARSAGSAVGAIRLTVDRGSGDIVKKGADILDTTHGEEPPAADVEAMVQTYDQLSSPRVNRVITEIPNALKRGSHARVTPLGAVIADAQRAAMKADIALMNPGGIRADLPAGTVTWGELYSVQPFNNALVQLTMTGAQIRKALEQQWGPGQGGQERATVLQPSGLEYTYDPTASYGARLLEVKGPDGKPLDNIRTYSVVVNAFLAGGGDQFSAFTEAGTGVTGPMDLDALIDYLKANPKAVGNTDRVRPYRP